MDDINKKPVEKPSDKKDGYKTLPFKDYVKHTSEIEGGDPEFAGMFPKEKEADNEKRNTEFRAKHGEFAANREFWGDVYNKPIDSDKNRLGDVVLSTANKQKLDPKMLLGSVMEEGGYKLTYGAKENYSGSVLGLEDFHKDVDKLKSYLPEGFDKKVDVQKSKDRDMATFKDPKDMVTALSAYLGYYKDEVSKAAKSKGITLTPEAESFFTQAAYNSSKNMKIDNVSKMMDYYKSKGLLKNDKFLTEDALADDKYGQIYQNTRRRIDAVNGLEKEGSIDLSEKRQKFAEQGTWTKNAHGSWGGESKQGKVFKLPDGKYGFDVLILNNGKKKVLKKGENPDTVDVEKLKDIDEYDLEANK